MRNPAFYITCLCILGSLSVSGQSVKIRGGLNIAEIHQKDGYFINEYEVLAGPHLGLHVNVPVWRSWFFESGVVLSRKGFRITGDDYFWIAGHADYRLSLYYLSFPLVFKKVNKISAGTNQYFLFGAYMGIGLRGRLRESSTVQGHKTVDISKIRWGEDLRREDAGVRIGVGWELGNLVAELSYEFGLMNLVLDTYSNPYDDYKLKNMALLISIGMKLKKAAD